MSEKVIVFQGDSITDCGRDRSENATGNGNGYPQMVQAALSANYPYQYKFYNRGISGNRVVDLYARIKVDMINLHPDYLSILIGINDVWHEYTRQNGVDAEKYEMVYGLMIEELKKNLPNLKIMILEPFVLPGSATENTEEHPGRWEYFKNECTKRRWAAKRVADKYGLVFVPLQDIFNKVNADAPESGYWLRDGVHPTPAGHEIIKREWLKVFENMK
ncbi:MAG: SGNH/GDSL hydrolase family protein [Acutalibacteraceae bacterium]|jgi:lysophospholipase L1-like esterase